MSDWLAPLRAALDAAREAGTRATFFVRDDDAGWSDERLWALLPRLHRHGLTVDVAVIPAEVTARLAESLLPWISDGLLAVHQHGWVHVNHEATGRKHEFGPSRSAAQQRQDVEEGRGAMALHFGPVVGDVFVPPWNRCTSVTAGVLAQLGFRVLARDVTAKPIELAGLQELPVTVDWLAKSRDGGVIDAAERGRRLAAAVGPRPVGVMLHHAVMDDRDLAEVEELAALLAGHPAAEVCRMQDLA